MPEETLFSSVSAPRRLQLSTRHWHARDLHRGLLHTSVLHLQPSNQPRRGLLTSCSRSNKLALGLESISCTFVQPGDCIQNRRLILHPVGRSSRPHKIGTLAYAKLCSHGQASEEKKTIWPFSTANSVSTACGLTKYHLCCGIIAGFRGCSEDLSPPPSFSPSSSGSPLTIVYFVIQAYFTVSSCFSSFPRWFIL